MKIRPVKEFFAAKKLYLQNELLNQDISKVIGISSKTLTRWIQFGEWKKERERFLATKADENPMYKPNVIKAIVDLGKHLKIKYPSIETDIKEYLKSK